MVSKIFIEHFNEKKEMVCNIPYWIKKQANMYRINSVNNHFLKPFLISSGRWDMRLWVLMTQIACWLYSGCFQIDLCRNSFAIIIAKKDN